MTVEEFFNKYNGVGIDFDGVYKFQCVDVFKQFNKDVVNAPAVSGNAVDYWTKYPFDYYERVLNAVDNYPQLGDVVIWGKTIGPYGHIAICRDATLSSFVSFDQNWPVNVDSQGNGLGVCHFQPHNYTGVLGWLRPKSIKPGNPTSPIPESDIVKVDLGGDWGIMEIGAIKSTLNDLKRDNLTLQEKSKQLDGFISKWVEEWKLPATSNLVEIEGEMSKLVQMEDTIQDFRSAIESLVGVFETDSGLLTALGGLRSDISDKVAQINDLTKKLELCKTPKDYSAWKSFKLLGLLVKLYTKTKS